VPFRNRVEFEVPANAGRILDHVQQTRYVLRAVAGRNAKVVI